MSQPVVADPPNEPLPVMQLKSWVPANEPLHVMIGGGFVWAFLWFVQRTAGHTWLTVVAGVAVAAALWRLWLPIEFEFDARGVQQIVFGRRRFWPWSIFARYEVDPKGVALIRDPRHYPLARAKGLYIPAAREHVQLVQLVDRYLGSRTNQSASVVSA